MNRARTNRGAGWGSTFGAVLAPRDEPPPGGPTAPWSRRLRRLLGSRLGLAVLIGPLLAGPVFATTAYRVAADRERAATEREFGNLVTERVHDIDNEFQQLAEVLHACRGLFDSSKLVERSEFATFTREARARHPSIVGIGYAPRVLEAERAAHEALARADGLASYRMTARGPDRGMVAAPAAEEHWPILYVEPLATNEAALGFDLGSDPVRREAMHRAVATARAAVSEPTHLLPRPDGGPGAVLELAIYDSAHVTPHPGDAPIGFVLLGFVFADVLRVVQWTESEARSDGWSRVDLSWSAVGPDGRRKLIHPSVPDATPRDEAPFAAEDRLSIGGQEYVLHATPTARFLREHRSANAILIAALVLGVWELLAVGLYVVARWWRSSALDRQSRAVQFVLRSLAEGVVTADRGGAIQTANDAALRMLGVSMDDLRAPDWSRRCDVRRDDGRTPFPADEMPLVRAAAGEIVPDVEMRIGGPVGIDGPRVAATARPLVNELGVVQGGVMVLRDVADHRRLLEVDDEMRLASEVQKRLFPREAPVWDGFEVAGAVLPAVATAGDYYDYFRFPDGSLGLAVGDVSGHGLGPALVMAETRAYLRMLVDAGLPIAEILRRVNTALRADLAEGQFVTLLLAAIDPATGRISYASAGHTPGLLLDATGAVKAQIAPTGPALAVFSGATYRRESGPVMEPGDVLVLTTDGVSERAREDGDFFAEEGVIGVVSRCCARSAAFILERLQSEVEAAAPGQARRDDITIVVCKAVGRPVNRFVGDDDEAESVGEMDGEVDGEARAAGERAPDPAASGSGSRAT